MQECKLFKSISPICAGPLSIQKKTAENSSKIRCLEVLSYFPAVVFRSASNLRCLGSITNTQGMPALFGSGEKRSFDSVLNVALVHQNIDCRASLKTPAGARFEAEPWSSALLPCRQHRVCVSEIQGVAGNGQAPRRE